MPILFWRHPRRLPQANPAALVCIVWYSRRARPALPDTCRCFRRGGHLFLLSSGGSGQAAGLLVVAGFHCIGNALLPWVPEIFTDSIPIVLGVVRGFHVASGSALLRPFPSRRLVGGAGSTVLWRIIGHHCLRLGFNPQPLCCGNVPRKRGGNSGIFFETIARSTG